MKTLKSQVAYILELYPETRSSDIELAKRVWKEFYLANKPFFKNIIHLDDLHKLPSYDNICRYRRLLTPLFPATEEVMRHRRRLTKGRKEEFGKSIVEQTKDIT
jgi:hypothetical protein